MKIGAVYGAGFDPYKDYTAALKNSVNISATMPKNLDPSLANVSSGHKAEKSDDATDEKVYKISGSSLRETLSLEAKALEDESPKSDERVQKIAESLKGIQDFELIGRDASLDSLDTKQAISDMKKDSILQQYQYFVGDYVGTSVYDENFNL